MPASLIQCEKCGTAGTPDRAECAKCGGRVVRVCGDCKFKNSLAKRFCDTCGARLDGTVQKMVEPSRSAPRGPENFVFESLAESATNELEEHDRLKAGLPPKSPERHPERKPERSRTPPPPPPPSRSQPPPPTPVDKPKPASSGQGFNELPGLHLEPPASATPAAPPKRDLGLPHTVIGRAVRPPSEPGDPANESKPPARGPGSPAAGARSPASGPPQSPLTPSPTRPAARQPIVPPPPPPPRAPAPPAHKPKAAPVSDRGARKVPPMTRAAELLSSGATAKLSTGIAITLLLSGIGLWAARRRHMDRPEVQVPITARRYLNALKSSEFSTAYAMLTEASRRACPLEEFKKVRDASAWDFADISLVSVDRDIAFVRYQLRVEGREPEEDFLVFQKEGRAWGRPFVWNLLRDIEAAFDRGDAAQALGLARAALAVNPRDPMSQAYVCEALYYLRDPARAAEIETACRAALELSERYPSALSLNSTNLYHIRAILGDTFKNSLRRYKEASEQYTALLMFPRIGPGEQCELLLGRAECGLALQDFPAAVQDFSRAGGLCESPADLEYSKRAFAVYSGGAQQLAIELAQQHPLESGAQTLLEWRKSARAEMTQQWKAQGRGALPPEDWHAQHLGGSQYRVDVRAGDTVLLSARVDLWTKLVQVETQ